MKPITILVIALFAAMLFTDVDVSAQEMPDSLIVSPAVNADTDSVPPMTLAVSPDSVAAAQEKPHSSTLWIKQLLDNGFLINDPGVDYPKFPRFLVKVYNWGDKVFNSYDPEYVVSTGKNWKLQAKSFNWLETYTMQSQKGRIWLNTHPYAYAGPHIYFLPVSLGYMFNLNKLT